MKLFELYSALKRRSSTVYQSARLEARPFNAPVRHG